MLANNNNKKEQISQEKVSENIRSVVLEIIAIQSKLLSLRNDNREVLNEISRTAIANTFQTKDLEPGDLLVKQFSEIEQVAISLLKSK